MPPTNYTLWRREYRRASGVNHYQVVPSNWSKYTGFCGGGGGFNSLNHWTSAIDEPTARQTLDTSAALVKARLKIKNKRVDLGVAYAERKATAWMLGDTATRLGKAVRSLRRGSFREAARTLGILNEVKQPRGSNWINHWLALQYGWKPLLSDLYGAADALRKRPREDWLVTAKAASRDTNQWKYTRSPTATNGVLSGGTDACEVVADRQRGVFVRIDALPENDLTMSFVQLGLTNPLLVAWEVVPYSFVIDWFLPIGNWLDSLDALLGYSQSYTSITTRNEIVWDERGISKDFSKTSFVHNDFVGWKRILEVKRTAQSGVPLPTFPAFKDPASLLHAANGLSLLAGSMGRNLHPTWGGRGLPRPFR